MRKPLKLLDKSLKHIRIHVNDDGLSISRYYPPTPEQAGPVGIIMIKRLIALGLWILGGFALLGGLAEAYWILERGPFEGAGEYAAQSIGPPLVIAAVFLVIASPYR
jgi:hypothetical protein